MFDSGVINRVFDALEESQLKFSVLNCDGNCSSNIVCTDKCIVRPNKASVAVPSNVKIEVTGPKAEVDAVASKLQSIVESVSEAKATVNLSVGIFSHIRKFYLLIANMNSEFSLIMYSAQLHIYFWPPDTG